MYNNGVQGYRRTNIITADSKRLVLMCYEGAIDNLKIAKQRMKEKDYEGKGQALIKAQNIISELRCALDFEKGGTIAKNLDSLYHYMLKRTIHGDLNKDSEVFDEVIGILEELHSAWDEIFQKKGQETRKTPLGIEGERKLVSNYINV